MKHLLLSLTVLIAVFAASPDAHAQREQMTPEQIEYIEKRWPGTKKTGTGIRYVILEKGDGPSPKPGDRVAVLYTGTLLDGTKFDERLDPEKPLEFRVSRGDVIRGWDQTLQAMKLNEKRVVIIPSSLAYGARGRPPDIPRNATLVFEMKLIKITPP